MPPRLVPQQALDDLPGVGVAERGISEKGDPRAGVVVRERAQGAKIVSLLIQHSPLLEQKPVHFMSSAGNIA